MVVFQGSVLPALLCTLVKLTAGPGSQLFCSLYPPQYLQCIQHCRRRSRPNRWVGRSHRPVLATGLWPDRRRTPDSEVLGLVGCPGRILKARQSHPAVRSSSHRVPTRLPSGGSDTQITPSDVTAMSSSELNGYSPYDPSTRDELYGGYGFKA